MTENEISKIILHLAIEVHRTLGGERMVKDGFHRVVNGL